jgi:hypothetical protein
MAAWSEVALAKGSKLIYLLNWLRYKQQLPLIQSSKLRPAKFGAREIRISQNLFVPVNLIPAASMAALSRSRGGFTGDVREKCFGQGVSLRRNLHSSVCRR